MSVMIRTILVLVIFCFGTGSFPVAEAMERNQKQGVTYKMKKGDTLWKLARKHYGAGGKYVILVKANNIKDPRKIRTGKVINIPNIHDKLGAKKKVAFTGIENGTSKDRNFSAKNSTSNEITIGSAISEGVQPKQEAVGKERDVAAKEIETKKADKSQEEGRLEVRKIDAAASRQASPALDFTDQDVMLEENILPNSGFIDAHAHSYGNGVVNKVEHAASLGLLGSMYMANKAESMKATAVDYMAWFRIPGLDDRYRIGTGIFTGLWENQAKTGRFRGILPGAQVGFKFNHHDKNHLMRMFQGKLMAGYEFQTFKPKSISPTSKMSEMADASMDAGGELKNDGMQPAETVLPVDSMGDGMKVGAVDSAKLGMMLEYHHELGPNSMLGLMSESWLSSRKIDMAMDPGFSLSAYHTYKFGDWTWKAGIGPEYENWSRTWRLKIAPAEIGYKDWLAAGVFTNIYPWRRGDMYQDFSARDLDTLGAYVRFSLGGDMHKGHEIKTE